MLFKSQKPAVHVSSTFAEKETAIWHSWPGIAVLFLFLSLFACSCNTTGPASFPEEEVKKCFAGYWVDDSTYRIATASAVNKKGVVDIEKRKSISRKNAVELALQIILEKLKGYRMEAAGGVFYENREMRKEMKRIIKNGKILRAIWDNEQNCEIIYEVKAKGLKDKLALWIEYRSFK